MSTRSCVRSFLTLACVLAFGGCGLAGESGSSNDCEAQVRSDGIVYTQVVVDTDHQATRLGTAEWADCDDVGVDARGSFFPDDPRLVDTWQFAGYPTDEVLGVRIGQDPMGVFVADSVPPGDRDRLFDEFEVAAG